jgi:putative FmdB family regulatory protein
MPTYDYACKTCQAEVSFMVSINDNIEPPICVECKAEMIRSYGLRGVTFKGNGWASKEK